ncbi:GntR family transcriptional regulator [Roseococcus pinisoli]|uniref:FCD domain-containing protein n=1 Tax=Roseococcus pinisoli TaxID=2835040 RepID=A0ABS5QHW4_9PROT|nr:FCD domain-containing protein [Roseococcus pinisoli]MBS7813274.1 FCD domain-containing protein [Roseococcus pinisoli]
MAQRRLLATKPESDGAALAASVEAELEAMIARGELGPGQHINELALARRLGVSRGPVREAARALERMGLVTVILNRGAFVRELQIDEALAIYDLTAVLLGYVAGRLATSISAAQLLELQAHVGEMEAAAQAGQQDVFFDTNVRFHKLMFSYAGNAPVEAVYLAHTRKLLLLRRRSFDESPHMLQSNGEHREIMDAILSGDAELARQVAERHGRAGRTRFLRAIAYREA